MLYSYEDIGKEIVTKLKQSKSDIHAENLLIIVSC